MTTQLTQEQQEKREEYITQLRTHQKKIVDLQSTQQKLRTKLNETEMAKKELELTAEGDEVYKKVGTVLYPQDRQETIQILAKEESLLKDEIDKISTIMDGIEKAIKEIQNKVAELSQPQKKN